MKFSSGQLITLYDFQHHMADDAVVFPVTELVVDLDSGALMICRCTQHGEISQLGQTAALSSGTLSDQWLAAVSDRCGADPLLLMSLLDELQVQRRLWNYYQSRQAAEMPALRLPGEHLVTCQAAIEAFDPIRQQLEHALTEGLQLLETLQISEDDLRIFVAGKLAESAPARYTLRSKLCGSPLMPEDSRFVSLQPGEAAAALRSSYKSFEQTQQLPDALELLCVAADGSAVSVPLAEKGQPYSALEAPAYSAAFLAEASEPLQFRMGAQHWSKPLPYTLQPSEVDLLEAACVVQDGRPLVRLRRCAAPAQVYDLPLETQ